MKILLVKPNEYAVEAEIENNLKAEQEAVGGYIEVLRPNNDPVAYVMNEEGKMLGLKDNRALYDGRGNVVDIIAGTFFVCGVKGDHFVSLSSKLMEKYKEQFLEPEIFSEQYGRIKAIKLREPVGKSIAEQLKAGAKQAEKDNAARPAPGKSHDSRE